MTKDTAKRAAETTSRSIVTSRFFVAAAGATLVLALLVASYADPILNGFLQESMPDVASGPIQLFTDWGLYPAYFFFAFCLVAAVQRQMHHLKSLVFAYITTQLLFSFLLVRALKILIGRARPDEGSEFDVLSFDPAYNSFPSGHSADAFVSAMFMFYMIRESRYHRLRFAPFILASLMALSRMAVNAHYLTDVLAGAAIGILGAHYVAFRLFKCSTKLTFFRS